MKALAVALLAAVVLMSVSPASAGDGQGLFEGWNEVDPWEGPSTENVRNTISTLNATAGPAWQSVARYDAEDSAWDLTFREAPLPALNTLAGLVNGETYWIFVSESTALAYYEPGGISGNLMYPSEGIPPLSLVFTNLTSGDYWWMPTALNQTDYLFEGLPPGAYHVVAYVTGGSGTFAGGYSEAVPCGLSVKCTDHTLIDVMVVAGLTTAGVTPGDWYAPPGAFPERPADVP